jgi:hypothetical protein
MILGYILAFLSVFWLIVALFVKLPNKILVISFFTLWLAVLGFILLEIGFISLIYLFSVLFIAFCFMISFFAERVYNYLYAITFLILVPFLLIIKQDEIAEFFAAIVFLFLVLGFVKDTLYEKIIKS